MIAGRRMNKLSESRKRVKAPERPEGSLTIREAAKANGVAFQTLARWVDKSRKHPESPLYGKIIVMGTTENCVYLEPDSVKTIADEYRRNAGQGKRTVFKSAMN